ncbi:MAG: hypothetical protein AAGE61_08850, partial [Pseudomonadota bacterium]
MPQRWPPETAQSATGLQWDKAGYSVGYGRSRRPPGPRKAVIGASTFDENDLIGFLKPGIADHRVMEGKRWQNHSINCAVTPRHWVKRLQRETGALN